jgi:hypothetical protein
MYLHCLVKLLKILLVYLFTPYFHAISLLGLFSDPCVIFKLPEEKSLPLLVRSAWHKIQFEFSWHNY